MQISSKIKLWLFTGIFFLAGIILPPYWREHKERIAYVKTVCVKTPTAERNAEQNTICENLIETPGLIVPGVL